MGGSERDWFGEESSASDAARLAALYDLDNIRGDDAADVQWFRALARRTGGPVLELGCGTGRVAVPVAKDGHAVVGVDRSAAMLARAEERARRAGARVRLVEGDMRTFSFGEAFALIAIPFNTFLVLEPSDRWACLSRVREHLAPNGRLALDVFQPDPQVIAGRDGAVLQEWSRQDPSTGARVTKFSSTRADVDATSFRWWYDEEQADRTVRRYQRSATLHFLYRREAELLLGAAGFTVESLHGDYAGTPADASSAKLLLVALRRERGSGRDRRLA